MPTTGERFERAVAIMAKLRREFAKIKDADVKVFGASPIPGLSPAGGFKLVVEDRGGIGNDPRALGDEILVGDLAPLAGSLLDQDLMAPVGQLPRPGGGERHPVLVVLDLCRDSEDHVCAL